MKEMYKDNAGNWHYGCKGEKLTEVSYSANSVPNSIPIEWIKTWAEKWDYPRYWAYRDIAHAIIEDWEKENEID